MNLTLTDALSAPNGAPDVVFATLNGKLFIAYDSAVNRMHVYSPTESTSLVRRVGLAPPAAPTVANTGSGSYAATPRWYKEAVRVKSGGTILRQSNLSAAVAFTPSGSGTAARVTKAAATGEGETHWVVYGAAQSADGPYYELAETVVATTTYDDSEAPSNYSTHELSPLDGAFFPFPSTKFILSDGTRLFGLGVYESAAGDSVDPKPGRLYWTPPLGVSEISLTVGVGDDERIQNTVEQDDWLDLGINGPGGTDTGLAGPVQGVIFAFQWRGVYQAIPTGQATAPFKRLIVTTSFGNVRHQMLVVAEDETGAPCVYFWDPLDGPRRVGLGGTVQWLGKDVFDLVQTVNLAATIIGWGAYDKTNKRVIWAVATGSSATPDTGIVFHVALGQIDVHTDIRKGWAKWTGALVSALCGVMFPNALTSPRPLKHCLYSGAIGGAVVRQDGTSNQDGGVSYQGYVESKAFSWDILARRKRATEAYLTAKAQAATTITVKTIKNWGTETITETAVSIAPSGSETRLVRRIEDLDNTDLIVSQTRIGDASAANVTWTLDQYDQFVEALEGATS